MAIIINHVQRLIKHWLPEFPILCWPLATPHLVAMLLQCASATFSCSDFSSSVVGCSLMVAHWHMSHMRSLVLKSQSLVWPGLRCLDGASCFLQVIYLAMPKCLQVATVAVAPGRLPTFAYCTQTRPKANSCRQAKAQAVVKPRTAIAVTCCASCQS